MLPYLKKGSSDNLHFETSNSRRLIYWAIVFGVAAWRDLQLSSRVSNVQATSLEQFWTRGAVKTCLPPDVCLSLLKKTTLWSMFYTQNKSVLEALMKLHCASDGPSMFPLMPKKVYEDFPGAATRLWRPGTEKKAHPLCSASTATSKRVLFIIIYYISRWGVASCCDDLEENDAHAKAEGATVSTFTFLVRLFKYMSNSIFD